MWRWADVKMRRWEDVKMRRCEDVKMRRDKKMWRWADVKMRRCEDEKMFYRPPLLEEPCAQTLSGKIRDLNGLRDPSFPLHLVKEKMCYLDVFGLNLDWWPHFVSPYAPSGHALLHHVSPGCGRRTQRKPTWNPTSLTFGGPSSSKFTKKM